MVSNLFLGASALFLFLKIRKYNNLWSLFFLFMSISAFVGGAYHGFPKIGESYRFLSWSLTSISLLYAQFAVFGKFKNKLLNTIFVVKACVLLFLAINYSNFNFMVIDTSLSLLGFIVLGNALYLRSLSNYISYGILVSLVSVVVIAFDIYFEPYTNRNDICHYITIISLIVMSRGIKEDALKETSQLLQ